MGHSGDIDSLQILLVMRGMGPDEYTRAQREHAMGVTN